MDPTPTPAPAEHPALRRIESLSDGVFGTAMTLLLITFGVLRLPGKLSDERLNDFLLSQWPGFLHFVQSFIIVSAFWIEHHQQFRFIVRVDWRLMWLNILGLLLIALVPITSILVGDYGHLVVAALLFEVNIFAVGAVFSLTWLYATRNGRLVEPALDPGIVRHYRRRSLVSPIISLLAMAVSLRFPRGGTLLYFLVPPLVMMISRRRV